MDTGTKGDCLWTWQVDIFPRRSTPAISLTSLPTALTLAHSSHTTLHGVPRTCSVCPCICIWNSHPHYSVLKYLFGSSICSNVPLIEKFSLIILKINPSAFHHSLFSLIAFFHSIYCHLAHYVFVLYCLFPPLRADTLIHSLMDY